MKQQTAEVVICGAGIAGVAAAYSLSVDQGVRNIALVDAGQPLSLTSDKSTEAYRNWWPGPDDAMLRFMNRSIDLLEQHALASGNVFLMNRRGYYYATADVDRAQRLLGSARVAEAMGAGQVRTYSAGNHSTFEPPPFHGLSGPRDGADFIEGRDLVQHYFPFLAQDTAAVLLARRCGWLSGQQLGMYLLGHARRHGVHLINGRVVGFETGGGRIEGVRVRTEGEEFAIRTSIVVDAAGPMAREVALLLGEDLPLFSERHLKIAFEDRLGAVPRGTGLVICEDPITFAWSTEEREELAADPASRWLTEPLPAGVHMRPEGYAADSQTVLVLWAYHTRPVPEVFPVPMDPEFPEVALRGMARLIPAMSPYTERLPRFYQDGGYYTKTAENRPLIGPCKTPGAFLVAGLSGYGIMAACAAGELLAAHVTGRTLPEYAPAFDLRRYDDEAYRLRLSQWGDTGQL